MFSSIISPSNPRVKRVSLLKESRVRRKTGMFLVDGTREILRALQSEFKLVELFWDAGNNLSADERVIVDDVLRSTYNGESRREIIKTVLEESERLGIPIIPLSSSAFGKIVFGSRNEGVVAVVRAKDTTLKELEHLLKEKVEKTDEAPLLGIVEGVEKPGNIGAILRSADGAGVDALIIVASSYDVFNPNTIRGSLGTIFNMPIVVAPTSEVLPWLRERAIQRVTALCDEAVPYIEIDYKLPTAIILGSEAEGLTMEWTMETTKDIRNSLLQKVRLPMLGIADSLNVSNAAAILFYEARRVRSSS